MVPRLSLLAVLVWCAGCGGPAPQSEALAPTAVLADPASPRIDGEFWKTWGDGAAELASFDLVYPRYGSGRKGTAVAIFVSETFAAGARVKSDPGNRPRSEEFSVMKLNLVEDFQTGIYDYNLMLQAFVTMEAASSRPAGVLSKAVWSSQEWCGALFKQVLVEPAVVRTSSHSYFDGEADQQKDLAAPVGPFFSEDALLLWARGMAWPVLAAGEKREVPALLSLRRTRFDQGPAAWGKATLERHSATDREIFTARMEGGPVWTVEVTAAAPHRVLRYSSSEGLEATAIASERSKYWERNRPGGEEDLKRLGLKLRPPRTM